MLTAWAAAATRSRLLQEDATSTQVADLENQRRQVNATYAVESATAAVRRALHTTADETSRAQPLAIWVAIGTALSGAVVGAFATV